MRGPEFSGPQPGRGAERAGQTTTPKTQKTDGNPRPFPAPSLRLPRGPGSDTWGPGEGAWRVSGDVEAASADCVPRAACGLHCHLLSWWFSVGSWGEAEGGTICRATGAECPAGACPCPDPSPCRGQCAPGRPGEAQAGWSLPHAGAARRWMHCEGETSQRVPFVETWSQSLYDIFQGRRKGYWLGLQY